MRRFLVFMTAVIAFLSLTACNSIPGEINAGLGEIVSLSVEQIVAFKEEPLKLKFVDVESDSRCPTGVSCIWAGEVKCRVEITRGQDNELLELVQPGGSPGFVSTSYHEYRIDFDILPYPEAGKETNRNVYRLKVKITK